MRRLLINVDDMVLDDIAMSSFWHTFIDKVDEIKAVIEETLALANIKQYKKKTRHVYAFELHGYDMEKRITEIIGDNPAPYYFTLDVFPSDCGVWAEYNDCVRLNVHNCNVGG